MEVRFTPEFFEGNRAQLKQLFPGTAPIVLGANGLVQRNADTNLAFRQDSNFWYLTGSNLPDLVLVMDKDKEYIILPEGSSYQDVFNGSVDIKLLSEVSGVKSIVDNKTGWKQLASRLKKVKHIATKAAAPAYIQQYGFYTNPAHAALISKLKDIAGDAELLDLKPHLSKLRAIKQPVEIEALQSAVDITAGTFKTIKKKLAKYQYEYEIEAELSLGYRQAGAYGHSYTPIVASGVNACTLHYVANSSPIEPKQLVLIDSGAEVYNYAADITRTLAVTEPTKRQRLVHEAVLEVQQFAIGLIKPGVNLRDYEHEVENFMGEKLRELGLIKSINHKNVRKFYPHGTSHFLGLDVHDVGSYSKPLEPNMVLTVEPGIYIAKEKIGIRIEDDVLVTADGNRVLSAKLPKSLW